MTTAQSDVSQAMVDRFNTRAGGYARWWAPVLAATARTLVDYVDGTPVVRHPTA